MLAYPVACTPLSDEVIRLLVHQYGLRAHPSEMVRIECDDVSSLLATVQASDAVSLGAHALARADIEASTGHAAHAPARSPRHATRW